MHFPIRTGFVPAVCLGLAALAGCGSEYEVVPVSGTITLDDKPLADATINTQPVGTTERPEPGPGSYGHTDADGRFSLELQSEPTPGAVVGQHRIYITMKGFSEDPTSDESTRADFNPLPPMYYDGTLTADIPDGGTDQFNFDLQSRMRRRR
jgi:hypothetical protein